jgi:hypothetical protein
MWYCNPLPIRLDTMHARPITQDDELLLYVEARQIIKVIEYQKRRKIQGLQILCLVSGHSVIE